MSATLTVVDVLRAARELYAANPSHCSPEDHPEWPEQCPMTAIMRTVGVASSEPALQALRAAAGLSGRYLPEWNAENSTETVLAAFDAAIEASS